MKSNGELKIEKGIPVPPEGQSRGRYVDVFRKMTKGDSVFIPEKRPSDMGPSVSRIWGKGNYRAVKEDNGVRLWRLK